MSGFCRAVAAVLVIAWLPGTEAFGWFRSPARVAYYYYPATVTWVPSYPMATYVPSSICVVPPPAVQPPAVQEFPAPRPYAAPAAAPPSGPPPLPRSSPEPPLATKPTVTESGYFDSYAVSPRASDKPPGERCQVGFWNLSGRELSLTVDGQTRLLPAGKSLKMDLARQFVWRIAGREPQAETVPSNESAMEIVIRR